MKWTNTIIFWPIFLLTLTITIILGTYFYFFNENIAFAKQKILQSTIEDGYLLKNIIEDYSLRKEPLLIRKNIIRFSTKKEINNIFAVSPNGRILYSSKSYHHDKTLSQLPQYTHLLSDIRNGFRAHIQNESAHVIFRLNYLYNPTTHTLQEGYLIVESDLLPTLHTIKQKTFYELLWLIALLVLLFALLSTLFYRFFIKKLLHLSSLTLHQKAGLFTDLNRLIKAQKEKLTKLLLYSQILNKTKDAIFIADSQGKILEANAASKKLLTPNRPHPLLDQLQKSIQEKREYEGQVECPLTKRTYLQSIIPIPSGSSLYYASIAKDITKLIKQQEKIERMAFYDELTGLANRTLLMETLDRFIKLYKRSKEKFALMFLDLDDFKEINDTLGHEYGDIVLQRFAHLVRTSIKEQDLPARLGGDEFALLCRASAQEALDIACRISEIVNEKLSLGTSVGIAIFPNDGQSAQTLLKAADIAMYRAKSLGKNRCVLFEEQMQKEAMDLIGLKQDLKKAIPNNQLSLRFQPKVCIRCKRVVGFEALLRWHHPTKGFISPAKFIPIAENSALIIEITEWIFEQIDSQMDRFLELQPNLTIALNISARHFHTKNLITTIKRRFAPRHHASLELEVTESAVMEDIDLAMRQLDHLKALGVKVSIDDYGTGHSSLAYLKFLPIDYIKVDKTFIDGITSDKKDRAIVQSVVDLAKEFGIKTVAEGVESKEQVDILGSLDVDIFQGYHFAKPMELDEALKFLRTFKL